MNRQKPDDSVAYQIVGDVSNKKKLSCMIIQNSMIQIVILIMFYLLSPSQYVYFDGSEVCDNRLNITTPDVCKIMPIRQQSSYFAAIDVNQANQFIDIQAAPRINVGSLNEGSSTHCLTKPSTAN